MSQTPTTTVFTGRRVLLDSGAAVGPATIYVDAAGKVARIENEHKPENATVDAGDSL
ncbi:hypothetical protein GGH99_002526, partial [Coemansia sp. RSA 1285]